MSGSPGTMFGATVVAATVATTEAMRVVGGMPVADALTSADVRASSRLFTGSTTQYFFWLRYVSAQCPETTVHDNVARYLSLGSQCPPGNRAESSILTSPLQRTKDNRQPIFPRVVPASTQATIMMTQ